MDDFEFTLEDRISKIKAINEQLDLENNSYIAISGRDSLVASVLVDISLPDNKIPRVFANTGMEYIELVKHIKSLALKDNRIVILNQKRNIKKTLEEYGYPFKSKEHSLRVEYFNKYGIEKAMEVDWMCKYIFGYKTNGESTTFKVPKIVEYQFKERGKYNYSNKCCYKLKKDLLHEWQMENKKKIVITGMKNSEGGTRSRLTCITNNGKNFHPLVVVSDEWEDEFIKRFDVSICKLYYPPYNFKRTGCKGCPFNRYIQKDLETLYKYLPNEYKQCLHLWKPVYDEYIRIGYRLKKYPHEEGGEK